MTPRQLSFGRGVEQKPITNLDDPRLIKALAHPLRIRILALLDRRVSSAADLAQELDASVSVIAEHVRALERLGLIELIKKSARGGAADHKYRSVERPSFTGEAWEQAPPVVRRAAIDASLAQINAFASAAAEVGGFDRGSSHLTRTELHLDEQGWQQVSDRLLTLFTDVEAIEAASQERLHSGESQRAISAGLVVLLFHAAGFLDTEPSHTGFEPGE